MTTYPTTPTTLTLASAFAGSILRDYRDSGFVQGTAVIRDSYHTKHDWTGRKISRRLDFLTAKTLSVAGVQTALVTTDVVQAIPLTGGEVVTGGSLRVIRAASAGGSATATIKIGGTAISAAIDLLATGLTVVNTATPIVVASDDTADILMTGTTSPVFDALIELTLFVEPNHA